MEKQRGIKITNVDKKEQCNLCTVGSCYHLNEKELSKLEELKSKEVRIYTDNPIGIITKCVVDGELIDITDYGSW